MTQYCEIINGIRICSNIPLDQAPPSNSQYQITINTNLPLIVIFSLTGISGVASFYAMISQQNFQNELKKQGYNGTISNYKVNIPSLFDSKIYISFTASSPLPQLIAYIILALVVVIGIYFISIDIQVIFGGSGPGSEIAKTGLGIFLIGAGIFGLYYLAKKIGGKRKWSKKLI